MDCETSSIKDSLNMWTEDAHEGRGPNNDNLYPEQDFQGPGEAEEHFRESFEARNFEFQRPPI